LLSFWHFRKGDLRNPTLKYLRLIITHSE
jgi:hypothetical protein